jgi:hypothetical protein
MATGRYVMTIPVSPVFIDPDMTTAGRRRAMLHTGKARSDIDVDLSGSGKTDTKRQKCKNCQFRQMRFHTLNFIVTN